MDIVSLSDKSQVKSPSIFPSFNSKEVMRVDMKRHVTESCAFRIEIVERLPELHTEIKKAIKSTGTKINNVFAGQSSSDNAASSITKGNIDNIIKPLDNGDPNYSNNTNYTNNIISNHNNISNNSNNCSKPPMSAPGALNKSKSEVILGIAALPTQSLSERHHDTALELEFNLDDTNNIFK